MCFWQKALGVNGLAINKKNTGTKISNYTDHHHHFYYIKHTSRVGLTETICPHLKIACFELNKLQSVSLFDSCLKFVSIKLQSRPEEKKFTFILKPSTNLATEIKIDGRGSLSIEFEEIGSLFR